MRACVIRQYYVPLDPRVWREAQALAETFEQVDVICMRDDGEERVERRDNLTIYRLPIRHRRDGKLRYLFEYGFFFILAALTVTALHLFRRYRLVQVHSMPDTLVFAALIPKLTGARVLLDLHETVPEFYATKFGVPLDNRWVRLVARAEQAAIRFADVAITPTRQMREAFISRGADPGRLHVVMNGADEATFNPELAAGRTPVEDGRFTLICHGSIEERYGLDTVIQALAIVRDEIPEIRFRIFGDGAYRPELEQLVRRLGVEEHVEFSDGFVPLPDLVAAIASADAGVVAMKRDIFRDQTLCLKMFDFISMEKPVICSRTRSVDEYFGDSSFVMFESNDAGDLARAIRELHAMPDGGRQLVERAARTAEPYRWPHQRERYRRIVSTLIDDPIPAPNDGVRTETVAARSYSERSG